MLKAEIMGGVVNLYEQFQICSPNIWGGYFALGVMQSGGDLDGEAARPLNWTRAREEFRNNLD